MNNNHKTKFAIKGLLAGILCAALYSGKAQVCNTSFTYTVNGNTVSFTNYVSGFTSPTLHWDFGDGNYSYALNPVHTFVNNGTYTVCLLVWDSVSACGMNGKQYCDSIVISGGCNPPQVKTTGTDPSGKNVCDGTVTANVTGGTPPYTYAWVYGGAVVSASSTASGLCTGCYSITVTDANGCASDDYMCITDSTNYGNCYAHFGYWSDGDTAYFSDNSYGATSWSWSFGDGTTSTQANPVHVYSGPGTYSVCLTVGCANSILKQQYCDTITLPGVCNSLFVQANGSYPGGSNVCNGSVYATVGGGAGGYSYSWMQNGNLIGTSVSVAGLCAGCYDIVVSDSSGCMAKDRICISDSLKNTVCKANFYWYKDSVNPSLVWVVNTGSGSDFCWDFGDGSPLYCGKTGSHQYANPGQYMVCLKVIDTLNGAICIDSLCVQIQARRQQAFSFSEIRIILPSGVTGIQPEQKEVASFRLYPNPVASEVFISYNTDVRGEAGFEVLDVTGKVMIRENLPVHSGQNKLRVDTSALDKGLYLVRLVDTGTGQVFTARMIK